MKYFSVFRMRSFIKKKVIRRYLFTYLLTYLLGGEGVGVWPNLASGEFL